jgi:hypothetical protein
LSSFDQTLLKAETYDYFNPAGQFGLVPIDSIDVQTLTSALTSERARFRLESKGSAFALALMLQAFGYFPTAAGAGFFKTDTPRSSLRASARGN